MSRHQAGFFLPPCDLQPLNEDQRDQKQNAQQGEATDHIQRFDTIGGSDRSVEVPGYEFAEGELRSLMYAHVTEGYLEAIRDGVIQPDQGTYESLLEETERLVRLAHALDDLALGDAASKHAHPVEIDLAAQLRGAAELVRPTFESRGLTLERRWPEPLPARADPDQFAQVLSNLLQNAARYAPTDGVVTLSAEQRHDTVLVSVTNSGESIPAADLPHVFERFYRVEKSRDRARGGAGIGLAIVKQLVEGWGGRVGAESAGGRTRFWFSLPQRPVTLSSDPR